MRWQPARPPDSAPPPPTVRTYRDAVLSAWDYQRPEGSRERYSRGAVYAGGALVPESLRLGGYRGDLVLPDDPPRYDADPVDHLEGRWLYGGHWMGQFGHFVTETLTSLWPVGLAGDVAGLVFHRFIFPNAVQGWQSELVVRSGWDVPIRVVGQPTLVDELVLPGRPFHPNRRTSSESADVWRRVAATAGGAGSGPPVYLSRTRLENDPRRSAGDDELDDRMRELGFAVLHPQELPIGDQLAAAAAAPVIASISGSALHVSAFAPSTTRVLEIGDARTRSAPLSGQLVIDAALGRLTAFVPYLGADGMRDVPATATAVAGLLDQVWDAPGDTGWS